jgi:hypothetical protein
MYVRECLEFFMVEIFF